MTASSHPDRTVHAAPIRVAVAVCTYDRNAPLEELLCRLGACQRYGEGRITTAVVVVDDNPDGRARAIVDAHGHEFPGGVHYRRAGLRNISIARNLALEAAIDLGEWVAMTDDDCEPEEDWLIAALDSAAEWGADAVTGPQAVRFPPGAPRWLYDEPFWEDAQFKFAEGSRVDVAATNNSFLSSRWLRDHPELRFAPELGVVGGEDMVFFRRAARAGMHIRFTERVRTIAREPAARATLRSQLQRRLWLGNSEAVVAHARGDAGRVRLLLRGANRIRKGIVRPLARLARGQRPQLRYAAATCLGGVGLALGGLGVRLAHH